MARNEPLKGEVVRGADELATLIYTSGTTGQPKGVMHVFFAESLDTFASDLQRARPTIFFSVPRLWVKFQHGVHHKLPPAKLNRLLSIPLIGGLVRRKVQKALGLDQCRFAAGGAAPMPVPLLAWYRKLRAATKNLN